VRVKEVGPHRACCITQPMGIHHRHHHIIITVVRQRETPDEMKT
jgi:hypothetical protein